MTRARAPFGAWPSKIDADASASASVRLAFPRVHDDGSWSWLEGRPHEGGRYVAVRRTPDGTIADASPPGFNLRSKVHEYGGRPHVFAPAGDRHATESLALFGAGPDGIFHALDREGAKPLGASAFAPRIAEPIADVARGRFIAVGEDHAQKGELASECENGLVTIDRATGEVAWLARGHDFYAAPVLHPSGDRLAFLAWDHPSMPWDGARVFEAPIRPDGSLGPAARFAGSPEGSAFQPLYSPGGTLTFALEGATGAWAPHRVVEGVVRAIETQGDAARGEWGGPLWNLGTETLAYATETILVGAVLFEGKSRVVEIDLDAGEARVLSDAFGHIGQLAARGDDVLFTTGWAGSGSALVHLARKTGQTTVVRDVAAALFESVLSAGDVPKAEPVSFATSDGDTAHGLFYAPASSTHEGPPGERPPLMVLAHGGPTGAVNASLQIAILRWTTRGFAVLDVNYRGSTGHGRAYREKLRGLWGEVDVDDCALGALAMAEQGRVDRARLLIRGGSAGGFTVLRALVKYSGVFAASTCLYGVSDPRTLTDETHKFESRYAHFLFGDGQARERAFRERSPLDDVAKITTPVLFFQGMLDLAVVPAQTIAMHERLRANGVATEITTYADEAHGFTRAENLRDVFAKEHAFYAKHLAL